MDNLSNTAFHTFRERPPLNDGSDDDSDDDATKQPNSKKIKSNSGLCQELENAFIVEGDDVIIKLLPSQNQINEKNADGYTALMLAVENKNLTVIKHILGLKPNLHEVNLEQKTALILACEAGDAAEEIVTLIMDHLSDDDKLKALTTVDNEGNSALRISTEEGYLKIAQALTQKTSPSILFAALSIKNEHGENILMSTVYHGHLNILTLFLSYLLQNKSNTHFTSLLNTNNIDGDDVFMLAVKQDFPDIVEYFIFTLDIAKIKSSSKVDMARSALFAAFENNSQKTLRKLVVWFKDFILEVKNAKGENILMVASKKNALPFIVNIICSFAHSPALSQALKEINSEKRTILILSVLYNHPSIVALLMPLIDSATLNVKDKNNETALMIAIKCGFTQITEILISHPLIDLNITDEHGMTALMKAAERGKAQTVSLLVQAGADLKIKNRYNQTALTLAQNKNCLATISVLNEKLSSQSSTLDSQSVPEFQTLSFQEPERKIEPIKKNTRTTDDNSPRKKTKRSSLNGSASKLIFRKKTQRETPCAFTNLVSDQPVNKKKAKNR